MNYQPIAAAVVAVSGLAGLYIQARRTTSHAAEEIKRELDILTQLPEDSALRQPLQARVEGSLRHYLAQRSGKTRDWTGAALSAVFAASAAFFVVLAMTRGGWWWAGFFVSLPLGLFGVIGILESVIPAERDAKGTRITPAPHDATEDTKTAEDTKGTTV